MSLCLADDDSNDSQQFELFESSVRGNLLHEDPMDTFDFDSEASKYDKMTFKMKEQVCVLFLA